MTRAQPSIAEPSSRYWIATNCRKWCAIRRFVARSTWDPHSPRVTGAGFPWHIAHLSRGKSLIRTCVPNCERENHPQEDGHDTPPEHPSNVSTAHAVPVDKSEIVSPLRSRCDGDHKNALFGRGLQKMSACMTALPLKAEVNPRSCYVAEGCRPRVQTRWIELCDREKAPPQRLDLVCTTIGGIGWPRSSRVGA